MKRYSAPQIEIIKPHTEPLLNVGSVNNKYDNSNIDLAPITKCILDDEDDALDGEE